MNKLGTVCVHAKPSTVPCWGRRCHWWRKKGALHQRWCWWRPLVHWLSQQWTLSWSRRATVCRTGTMTPRCFHQPPGHFVWDDLDKSGVNYFEQELPYLIFVIFYTTTFWGMEILHSEVRKFVTKQRKSPQQSKIIHCVQNYTLCVKLHTMCKITHQV